MVCPYSVLGISKSATEEEVKKAYHRLAKKYHPDRNHDTDGSKFREVNEAYLKIINNKMGDSPFLKFTGIDFKHLFQTLQLEQFGGILMIYICFMIIIKNVNIHSEKMRKKLFRFIYTYDVS